MGIQVSGAAIHEYGERVREQIEPASQRSLEMEILALKNQKTTIRKDMAETRMKRAETGDEATEKALKELRGQLMDVIRQLEKKQKKLDKIYQEQLQPKTKAHEKATRPVEERYDTIDISGSEAARRLEELEGMEEQGIDAEESAEMLRLLQELEEEGKNKVLG